jgi:hypothetical protein
MSATLYFWAIVCDEGEGERTGKWQDRTRWTDFYAARARTCYERVYLVPAARSSAYASFFCILSLLAGLSVMEPRSTADEAENPCQIMELLQYSCEQQVDASGRPQTHCFPMPRIFRMQVSHAIRAKSLTEILHSCQGRPAVEITKLVHIDSATGAVEIPQGAR